MRNTMGRRPANSRFKHFWVEPYSPPGEGGLFFYTKLIPVDPIYRLTRYKNRIIYHVIRTTE